MKSFFVALGFFVGVGFPLAGCVSDNAPIGDGGPPGEDTSTSTKAPGELCGTGGECATGFCVDGVCCDRACTGQCEACSVGATKGKCSTVKGNPIAPRAACTGTGACGGSCDGTKPACTYPAAGIICGGSCTGTCDGAGKCSDPGTGTCPDGFACGAGACKTTCTVNTDCQPFFNCDVPSQKCIRVPESDCLDGTDNNGDGLADCADPTCTDVTTGTVQCVPAVGGGQQLGTIVTTSTCPTGFGSAQAIYQGAKSGSCAGCGCDTQCQMTMYLYSSSNCTTGYITSSTTYQINGGSQACQNISDTAVGSAKLTTVSPYTCVGKGTPTWTASSPAWTTTKYFCPISKSSNTCASGNTCIPKAAISVKIAGGSSCPTGYATPATYYMGYSSGSCPACSSCTKDSSYNCGTLAFGFTGSNSCSGSNDLLSGNRTNYTSSCTNWYGDTIYSTYMSIFDFTSDNCTNNTTPTGPTPTSPQLVCDL